MASSKSSTSDKRRSTGKEKEYRESSKNRTSGHSRDLSKSRNEKTHKSEKSHLQVDKHRISSRDVLRQTARTTSSSKVESAKDLEERLSRRATKKVTEIIPVMDSNANLNTKLLDPKLKSRKVESITSNRSKATKETHSNSRSTLKSNPNENVNSKSVLKSSTRTVKEAATNKLGKLESTTNKLGKLESTTNKLGKLESNELSKKIKTLTSRYPTFDIENDEQSDVEDDYPDDFENYGSDFESSSGEDDEIEEKNNQEIIQPSNAPLPVTTLQSDIFQPSAVPLMVSDISATQNLTVSKPVSQSVKDLAVVSNQWSDQENTNIIERQHGQQITEEKTLALPKYSSKSYINFNTAKKNLQAQKVISKIKKRGDVLLDLITLDETPIDLFSLPPTTYDEFMVTFAGANTKQAYIQTGDDNVLEESQTDPIEMLDLWTQYPPYIGGAIGGEFMSKISKPVEVSGIKDWKRLSNFLNVSSRVICSILEEDQIGLHDSVNNDTKGKYDFSERVSHMDQQNHLQSKGICSAYSITCSKLQPHILLSACKELPMKKDDAYQNQMLICVWNIFQPTSPQKLLMCRYAVPLSCCLDDQANFAFAGMHDASVALWDLREPDSLHKKDVYDDNQWLSLRTPTYVTAGNKSVESHTSSVIAIRCQQDSYNSNNFSNKSLAGNKNSQGIIQLATLDEEAQIFIWVVTELSQPVLDWEHGLSPNGHVKLSKSLVINLQTLQTAQQYLKTHPRALNFITDPNDSSSFYVATDLGSVISCSLYGGKCKVYGNSLGHIAEATSLDFLWMEKPSYFLAGYNDGSIILYSAKKEKALMIWKIDGSKEVVKVQWSKSTPNIFYVLHRDGKLCVWDLKRNDRKPVTSISLNSKRIIGFDVGNDKRVQNSSVTNYQPLIVLGYDDGTVEAHYLTLQYSRSGPEEMEFFRKYVEYL